MLDKPWQYFGRDAVQILDARPDGFSLNADSTKFGYVVGGREDSNFSRMPDSSFIDFQAGDTLCVRAKTQTEGSLNGQWVIVTYSIDGKQTNHWGSPNFVEAATDADTARASLAFRFKGSGEIHIEDVRMAVSRTSLNHPIVISSEVEGHQEINLTANVYSIDENIKTSALVSCQFFDKDSFVVPPVANSPINRNFGAYYYMSINEFGDTDPTTYNFEIPAGSTTARIEIMPWSGAQSIRLGVLPDVSLTMPVVDCSISILETIEDFIDQVPPEDTLIIQHTTAPILGHPSLLLRPNRLAKEFADLGASVVFLPFSRVEGGAILMDGHTIMISREHWPLLQKVVGKRTGKNNVFICSSFPDNTAIFVADYLKSKNWEIVYEVRDDMEEFNRVGYSKWFDPMLERRMALCADTVVTVSPRLSDKMNIISGRNDAVTVPNAAAKELIEAGANMRGPAAEVKRRDSNVVGYIGHLTPSWFDWQLLIDAAQARPHFNFEIIGHGMPEGLRLPENILFLGPKSHAEYLDIAVNWRVGLIPFKPSTLTFAVDPNKLYEYLAVGLRVVSAQMGSVDSSPATFVYKSRNDFIEKLDSAMNVQFDQSQIDEIDEYLNSANWTARALTMLELFESKGDR